MKKFFLLMACIVTSYMVCSTYLPVKSKTAGAHPGSTGAPNEPTCAKAGCHSDAYVAHPNGGGVGKLTYSGSGNMYKVDSIYHFTLEAYRPSHNKFGFEITSLENSLFTYVGQLTPTDLTRTQLINNNISGVIRKYITHTVAGTPEQSPGKNSWSFDWKAPSTYIGPITLYYAINVTNNNNLEFGDSIYLGTLTLTPFGTNALNFLPAQSAYKAYAYNNRIFIQAPPAVMLNQIEVYNMAGKALNAQIISNENSRAEICLNSQWQGVAICKFIANKQLISLKVMCN